MNLRKMTTKSTLEMKRNNRSKSIVYALFLCVLGLTALKYSPSDAFSLSTTYRPLSFRPQRGHYKPHIIRSAVVSDDFDVIQIQPMNKDNSHHRQHYNSITSSTKLPYTNSQQESSLKKNIKRTVKMKKRKTNNIAQNNDRTTSSTIRVPNLLTREEEIDLTTSIRELKKVIHIRDDLSQIKTKNNPGGITSYLPNPMYKDQQTELPYKVQPTEYEWAQACSMSIVQLRRILLKGHEARIRLVDSNIGLVTQVAKKYSNALRKSTNGLNNIGCILTLSDLIQEGNLGIMEAAERFEADKGCRFSTYAIHWVRSRILRCIADNSRVIRLPVHVHTTLRTIRKAKLEMEQEIGRVPSLPELAHYLQMPISKLQLYTDSSLPVLSLEVPLNNGRSSSKAGSAETDKRTLMDKIASDSPSPQEDAEFESLKRDVSIAIDSLGNDLERDVLLNRFGLEDGNPRTLEETATLIGISRERVRRLEARALNKLRHPQRNYILKEYIEHPSDDDGHWIHNYEDRIEETSSLSQSSTSSLSNKNRNRVAHFGHDTLDNSTPEMIWSV